MLKITNQKRARYLLGARRQGGPTFFHFLRSNKIRYLVFIGYFGGFCAYMVITNQWFIFWVLLAFFVGALLSDMSWLRGTKKSWAFMERVMNWDEVKKVADEKPEV